MWIFTQQLYLDIPTHHNTAIAKMSPNMPRKCPKDERLASIPMWSVRSKQTQVRWCIGCNKSFKVHANAMFLWASCLLFAWNDNASTETHVYKEIGSVGRCGHLIGSVQKAWQQVDMMMAGVVPGLKTCAATVGDTCKVGNMLNSFE